MRRVRARVAEYCSLDRLRARGVDVFFGVARFTGPGTIGAGDATLSFRKALIATGARPKPSNITGLDEIGYLTSSTIFDIAALPKRLAIIGGGPLGCELAQAFCRLGAHVTIVQNDPKFLSHEGRDAAELLSMALSRDGVETRLNTTVVGARLENGVKVLDTINNEVKDTILADEILLSIGRVPNVEDLGLDAANIGCDPNAQITVDDYLRTTNPDVYAAGDVCVTHQFTNVAEATARIAVQNAFAAQAYGNRQRQRSHLMVPWCTFCDPEIAHIGLEPWEARRRSIPVTTFTVMMQDVDRAITDGQDDGFVKIHVRDGTDEIVGATIVAARASEMINEMSVIMSAGIGMRDLAEILHTYPAQSEGIRAAAIAFVRDRPGPN
jgi:pyruvate/2-oxoglutarate dehydrogenase complex dihydrolipoamide dehydrogenase (E3) component